MTHAAVSPEPVAIRAETPFDAAAIERVVMDAFGPGRFAKTAERLREGSAPAAGWLALAGGRVVGTVRLWPVTVGEVEALFLGPIAVQADARSAGVGAMLVEAALEMAQVQGRNVLLVGDLPYFGRFGFEVADEVRLPGPVERTRLLWRGADRPAGPVRSQ